MYIFFKRYPHEQVSAGLPSHYKMQADNTKTCPAGQSVG